MIRAELEAGKQKTCGIPGARDKAQPVEQTTGRQLVAQSTGSLLQLLISGSASCCACDPGQAA